MVRRRRGRPRKTTSQKRITRPRSRRTMTSKNDNLFSSISPETKKGIFVFGLLIIGFLSFLALFDLSGAMGRAMIKGMKWIIFFNSFYFYNFRIFTFKF